MINPFTTVKDYVMLGLIVAAVGWGSIQTLRLNSAENSVAKVEKTIADERLARSKQDFQRLEVASLDQERTANLEREHAAAQQRKFDDYEKQLKTANAQRDRAIADGQRVLRKYADYAKPASGDTKDSATGLACKLYIDRLEVLGQLAGESSQLVKEGESIIRQRNAEVDLLKGIIENDRKAVKDYSDANAKAVSGKTQEGREAATGSVQ